MHARVLQCSGRGLVFVSLLSGRDVAVYYQLSYKNSVNIRKKPVKAAHTMLEEIITKYLAKAKNLPLEKFEDPNLQVADLGLDSLDMVEMLFEIEDRCGFQLADPTRYPTMSFKEMIAAIEAEIREHNNGELPELKL